MRGRMSSGRARCVRRRLHAFDVAVSCVRCGRDLLTVLATLFRCLRQAVGLAVYASHEEQVDVMLAAIADGRRERVAASAAWAEGPAEYTNWDSPCVLPCE